MGKLGIGGLIGYLTSRLRYPQLFLLTAALFGLDLIIPDLVPFVDEILLGLMTVLLGSLQTRSEPLGTKRPPMKNVTPSDP
jgi:hypothetical protein